MCRTKQSPRKKKSTATSPIIKLGQVDGHQDTSQANRATEQKESTHTQSIIKVGHVHGHQSTVQATRATGYARNQSVHDASCRSMFLAQKPAAQKPAAVRLGLLLVVTAATRVSTVCPVVSVHSVQDAWVDIKAGGVGHLLKAPPLGCLRSAASSQCHTASRRQRGTGTRDAGAQVHTSGVLCIGSFLPC